MDLNKAMIIGRATADPVLRSTTGGANVCSFSIATNYTYTNQQTGQKVEQVEFHNIVLWRGLADVASKYVTKGKRVYVEGRISTRKWQTQNNEQRQTTEIIADNMILLDGGNTSNTQTPQTKAPAPGPTKKADTSSYQEEELPTIEQEEINIDEVPF